MPTAGYNVQTYKEEFLRLVEHRFLAASSPQATDNLVLRMLNEAFLQIQRELKWVRNRQKTLDMVVGTSKYDVPNDLLGAQIHDIIIEPKTTPSSGTLKPDPLARLSHDEAHARFDFDNLKDGEPSAWAMVEEDRLASDELSETKRQFRVLTSPDYAKTDGIVILYNKRPEPLRRIWHQTAITVGVTLGSATATLSSASALNNLKAGDEFGLVRTAQLDGSTISGESPLFWYRINSMTSTVLTLEDALDEATNTASKFITAQVHEIEKVMPGKLGFAPAMLAAGIFLETQSPEQSQLLVAKAMNTIRNSEEDEQGLVLTTSLPSLNTPFFLSP